MTAAPCILIHRCVCCQRRIRHTLEVQKGCPLPMLMTCQDCSESEGEGGYCWHCNHEGRWFGA